jgi:hypothetical protein
MGMGMGSRVQARADKAGDSTTALIGAARGTGSILPRGLASTQATIEHAWLDIARAIQLGHWIESLGQASPSCLSMSSNLTESRLLSP